MRDVTLPELAARRDIDRARSMIRAHFRMAAFMPFSGMNIANADVATSTRAAAADYTAARAAQLDKIDGAALSGAPTANSIADKLATILARLASTVTNVQYGSIVLGAGVTSAVGTITAVDTSKSAPILLGRTPASTTNSWSARIHATVALTSTTQVTATRVDGTTDALTVFFAVVTFTAPVSLQTFSITVNATSTSGTATIAAVTTSKAVVLPSGLTDNVNQDDPSSSNVGLTLTNATTVTASRIGTNGALTVTGTVVALP